MISVNKPERKSRMLQEVWQTLSRSPRALEPKWFYDAEGSRLFEEITRQPEYYPTQCERDILEHQGDDIALWIGPHAYLAELGAGNGEKAVLLLKRLINPEAYVPIDISEASLESAVREIHKAVPGIRVEALCRDFGDGLDWPSYLGPGRRCLVFFGSTIGNMEPEAAQAWLGRVKGALRPGDKMLLGVELKKDPDLLNAAYNDAAGVTAAFNRNALKHLNQALDADFNVDAFSHRAFYDPKKGRVEMHLESMMDQTVQIGPERLHMAQGERIHTESSYKYTVEEFKALTASAGFETEKVWLDGRGWFSLHGLSVL